ncbi:MAG: TlpA disulfide reductase family protein [Bacteroidales bacterium]|jgi:thiol-disulfide isomerase/thioredoxin|nr:TlpA disulfide reductase family protein [Bacteroidales bacterium]HKM30688.1 TlpA disulfide reductase family protein [Bacteroidales bacterium]
MKKSVYLLVSLLGIAFLGSCSTNQYTVTATFPDEMFDGDWARITATHDGSVLDSTIIEGQTAVFTGKIKTPVLCLVSSGHTRGQLILEGGTITIDMQDPGKPAYGEGTRLNTRLVDLTTKYSELMDKIMNYHGEDAEEYYETVWVPEFTKEIGSIFNANSNNDVGTLALMYLNNFVEKEELDTYLDKAGQVVRSRGPIEKIIKQRTAFKQTAEGMMFTDFTIEVSEDETVSFSDYIGQGKYVLVDFWAGWCGPCKREIPIIREVYDQYNGDEFTVLGVAVWEEPEATLQAIEDLNVVWPCIINAKSIPTDIYGISGIPHIILFGPDGTIVARGLRGDAMKAKIAEIMEVEE